MTPDARPRRATWLLLQRGDREVVQLRGPVLELMTESRTRFDQRLAGLGPDILAPELDAARFLRRLREDDPTRGIGDALLDQRLIAGIGNFWKSEGCFAAEIDPWRPVGEVSDDEALAIVEELRMRMRASASDGRQDRWRQIYNAARRPCPRCGPPTAHQGPRPGRRQPADVLVPELPALRRVGHKGADHIAPGNTTASFDAALAAGVDMIEFDVLPEDMDRPADSRLLLAHDYTHDLGHALTLEEGLAHLASLDVELDVDLKLPGYEARVVEALRAHGLVDRALISTTFMRSLVVVRDARAAAAAGLVDPARAA